MKGAGRVQDRIGVYAVQMIDVFDRSGLTEMFDPQRLDPVPDNPAQPA